MVEPDDQCVHGEHYMHCPVDTDGACRRGETWPGMHDVEDPNVLRLHRHDTGAPPPVSLRPIYPDIIA